MPTYVYRCEAGHELEIQQSITEAPLAWCPCPVSVDSEYGGNEFDVVDCGARLRRVIQPAGIVLKGSGWYRDGYGR